MQAEEQAQISLQEEETSPTKKIQPLNIEEPTDTHMITQSTAVEPSSTSLSSSLLPWPCASSPQFSYWPEATYRYGMKQRNSSWMKKALRNSPRISTRPMSPLMKKRRDWRFTLRINRSWSHEISTRSVSTRWWMRTVRTSSRTLMWPREPWLKVLTWATWSLVTCSDPCKKPTRLVAKALPSAGFSSRIPSSMRALLSSSAPGLTLVNSSSSTTSSSRALLLMRSTGPSTSAVSRTSPLPQLVTYRLLAQR